MRERIRLEVTFTCDHARELLRSLVHEGIGPVGAPATISGQEDVPADWIDALAPGEDPDVPITATFPDGASIEVRGHQTLRLSRPSFELDVEALAKQLSRVPFEIATFGPVKTWTGYEPPVMNNGNAKLGFGVAFRGLGNVRAISRRWLDRGPWRVLREPNDTTFVQLHDLGADEEESLAQARPGHALMSDPDQAPLPIPEAFHGGRVSFDAKYRSQERRMVVHVSGREISRAEMYGAAAARIYQLLGALLPVDNIAYTFVEKDELERALPDLWLYGLEARLVVADGWQRRDDAYSPPPYEKPDWVKRLGRDERGDAR